MLTTNTNIKVNH